jgi:uncharacterized protein (UPF0212 family)
MLYCDTELYVEVGEEKCPKCGYIGALAWVNPDKPEVEVDE